MVRTIVAFILLFGVACLPGPAWSITIPEQDVEPFTSPCNLAVDQVGSVRTLTWSAVSGAATYKVGYRMGTEITGLVEVTGLSYEHTGWNPSDCLEYILVAYDSSGIKVCSAHVENVGTQCPEE